MKRIIFLFFISIKFFILFLVSFLPFNTVNKKSLLKKYLEEAGGSFIKIGQILALRVDIVPKEYSLELLDLFDHVKPFSYKEVKKIYIKEFGTTPEKLFKVFEKTPFASASFGQVHAAKLRNGHIVAVKIQRPNIRNIVRTDFIIIRLIIFILSIFVKIEGLSWNSFFKEFKNWTTEELDYQIEAAHAQEIYNNALNCEHVVIPKTYHELSTSTILVQDYIDGIPLSRILKEVRAGNTDIHKLKKMNVFVDQAINNLVHEMARQYFFNKIYHADPHPGNIIIMDKGKIGLIDFGIVGKPAPNRFAFRHYMRSYAQNKVEEAGYYFILFAGEDLEKMITSAFPKNTNNNHVNKIMRLLAKDFLNKMNKTSMKMCVDIIDMKIDYAVMTLQILKIINKYKIKLPDQMTSFLRALSIIGFLAKEFDPKFSLMKLINDFFEKYPEESFPSLDVSTIPYRRMSQEEALERLNNWILYLMETEPELYHSINNYVKNYSKEYV